MRGGINNQINHLFNSSDIFQPGVSKHELKSEIRAMSAVRGEHADWHSIGKQLPIISFKSAEAYKDCWHQAATYIKNTYAIKDIEKISGEHLRGFLCHKADNGISKATFRQYAAACEKLETALNMYSEKFHRGNTYTFDLHAARDYGNERLESIVQSRAYSNPECLIKALQGASEIIASVQYDGGARISEVLSLRSDNLLGNNKILLDNTKGGLHRVIHISSDTYQKLKNHLEDNGGRFVCNDNMKNVADKYRTDLKNAAIDATQNYNGSHGLRWNFAQSSYSKHLKSGKTPEQSLSLVSAELGHRRSDITLHYLK